MRGRGFAFIAPLLVLMVVAFNLPILYMLGLAFWDKGRGFTLEHYEGLLEAPVYLRVLGNTMAAIERGVAVVIGSSGQTAASRRPDFPAHLDGAFGRAYSSSPASSLRLSEISCQQ